MESDLALLERFLADDEEAFTEIVERYQKKIYFFVLRIVRDAEDARDISQKAFIQAFKGASDFEGRSSFKTWLFKIAVNLSRNHLRDNQSYETVDVHSMDIAIPIGKNQLDILCEEERGELKKALTSKQMARYIIFQQRFEHEMKEMIREHRRERFPERGRFR